MNNKKQSCWFPIVLPEGNCLEINSVVKMNSSKSLCTPSDVNEFGSLPSTLWLFFQSLLEHTGTGICLKPENDSQKGKSLSNRYTQPLDASGTCLGKGHTTKETLSLSTHLPAPCLYLSQKSTNAALSWLAGAHSLMILTTSLERNSSTGDTTLMMLELNRIKSPWTMRISNPKKTTEDRCRWPKLGLWTINNDGGVTWWRSSNSFSRGFRQQEPGGTRQDKEDKDTKSAPALSG